MHFVSHLLTIAPLEFFALSFNFCDVALTSALALGAYRERVLGSHQSGPRRCRNKAKVRWSENSKLAVSLLSIYSVRGGISKLSPLLASLNIV